MSDPNLQAVGVQLSALSAQIQTESVARVAADAALAARIGSIETARVGDIQSANYVPGVSGWKLNHDGTFEISSCTLGSAAQAPERQMVSVEVASWSKYDLPKNASNLLQFMQAELQKVPEQYRHAAEFEEFDASYGDESFNSRLFLSYARLETEEELADRLAKAKVAGTRVSIKSGLLTISHDGVVRFKIGKLDQLEPFKVDGDQAFLNKAFVDDGSVEKAKVGDEWMVRIGVAPDGKKYTAGMGVGNESQYVVQADRFATNGRNASDILRDISSMIDETTLGQGLKEQVDLQGSSLAEQVKTVIRKELMPGGLLHRSR